MTEIKVEVIPSGATAGDLSVRSVAENLLTRVDDIGDAVMTVAKKLQHQIAAQGPDQESGWNLSEVELTFSLDLEAEAGVVISRASTTASFEVSLTWSRQG